MKLNDLQATPAEETNAFFISLSDVMILLCVFFIMLVSVSEVDTGSFEKVRSALQGSTENTLVELAEKLDVMVTTDPGIPGVLVTMANDGVRIDLDTAALFDSGSAVLKAGAVEPLIPLLTLVVQTDYRLDVEGHSDDQPFYRKKGAELDTNWSLSGRRASSVLHRLLEVGFAPERLRIVGYAETRPKVPVEGLDGEALDKARAENRRVSILIR
ncbi:MAG: OmpA family protein [Myxococcota bacterium]